MTEDPPARGGAELPRGDVAVSPAQTRHQHPDEHLVAGQAPRRRDLCELHPSSAADERSHGRRDRRVIQPARLS